MAGEVSKIQFEASQPGIRKNATRKSM